MERLSALINRLKERQEAGASNAELLLVVDQLKNELSGSDNFFIHTSPIVSVMMPSGYKPILTGILQPVAKVNDHQAAEKIEDITSTYLKEEIIAEERPVHQETFIEKKITTIPKPAFTVLRPPVVTFIEDEILAQTEPEVLEEISLQIETPIAEEILLQTETRELEETPPQIETPIAEEILLQTETRELVETLPQIETPVLAEIKHESSFMDDILGFLNFAKPEKRESPLAFSNEMEDTEAKPVVFELDLNQKSEVFDTYFPASQKMQPERERFEDVSVLEMPNERVMPKELHEILAGRVVATPSGIQEGKKVLADTLGITRISDLRKGMAVNDRFRYIKSLFRGDETLFERSVKTINNFNILAEAQYWMQRELVIKLGWNDEDELVQQFYSLVSRRFL